MTEQQTEHFRRALLTLLSRNHTRFGLTPDALATLAVEFGFQPTPEEVEREIQYLADKGLVAQVSHPLNPRNLAYRITATGRDIL